MKLKLAIAFLATALLIATNVALAKTDKEKHRGYPNHGISSPGQPNHYGSPHARGHP